MLTNIENIHDQFFQKPESGFWSEILGQVEQLHNLTTCGSFSRCWACLCLGLSTVRPVSATHCYLTGAAGGGGGHPCVSVFQVIDPPSKHTAAVNHCLPLETFSKNGHNSGNRKEISRSLRQKKDLNLFLTGIFFQTLEDWCFSLNFPIDRS